MTIQNRRKIEAMWIVFMTTYPPRECGLATFTSDLINSFDKIFAPQEETKVVAMEVEGSDEKTGVPEKKGKVIFRVSENKTEDYIAAAKYINNLSEVKVVSIQHEFGIFGNNDGEGILTFLEEIKKPVTVTFHTVLPNPSERILEIVGKISKRADKLIVMTQSSRELLENIYAVPALKIKVIHHGIHALSYTESEDSKKELRKSGLALEGSLKNKKVLSTFGLLNRGKGIEYAIEALPAIVREFPETQYLVLGATHPVVLRREGPVYINELREKAKQLGVLEHVSFYNSFFKTSELLKFLQATDIYLSLSQNPAQAVSGTLTYALGAGRPVISTPFMQAKEVITEEVGRLIKFNDSASIAEAVIALFKNPKELQSKGRAAYFRTRGMVWPNVAISYMHEFVALSPALALKEKALPRITLSHLKRMTDDFGMFQFAILTEPNPLSGYTLDDNARALIVAAWEHDRKRAGEQKTSAEIKLARVYLSLLEKASMENGGFINYYDINRQGDIARNTTENLEDSNARALWSIAELFASTLPEDLKVRAQKLFISQITRHKHVASPRAAAFLIKAFSIWISTGKADDVLKVELIKHIRFYADFLMTILNNTATPEWAWFEEVMTYSNAILPEALFIAYQNTGLTHYLDAGKRTLDFLLSHSLESSSEGNVCMPIGQAGWFKRGGIKELFDQQPEEVSALVLALHTASTITKKEKYLTDMQCVFTWFLGNNLLGQVIYSHATGGCYDGLGDQHINLNQGAESTVCYLLARLAIEKGA